MDFACILWHPKGGNNDSNVLGRSPLVRNMLKGNSNGVEVRVNGHWYDRYYLRADGIYPKRICFIQSIQNNEVFEN